MLIYCYMNSLPVQKCSTLSVEKQGSFTVSQLFTSSPSAPLPPIRSENKRFGLLAYLGTVTRFASPHWSSRLICRNQDSLRNRRLGAFRRQETLWEHSLEKRIRERVPSQHVYNRHQQSVSTVKQMWISPHQVDTSLILL